MIGRPYIKPTQQTIASAVRSRDLVASVARAASIQDVGTADDFFSVVQASYDVNLKDKGVCSSTPVNIAVIPFTKLTQTNNAEADILNIQRNLDTIAVSNVNEIINYVTSTLTTQENLALDSKSQLVSLNDAAIKITAAYGAKSAYMTHLADIFGLETSTNINYTFGTGPVPGSIPTIKITSFENKKDWIESYLKIPSQFFSESYNITTLAQIAKNSFARKFYGNAFTTSGSISNPLYVNPINISAFNAAATSYFGDLASASDSSILDLSDENTDILIKSDCKAVAYTLRNFDPLPTVANLLGKLSLFTAGLDLTGENNIGSLSSFIRYNDNNKSVLPVDVNIGTQAELQIFESADEYFLGLPLANNKPDLLNRRDKFAVDTRNSKTSFDAGLQNVLLPPNQDLAAYQAYVAQMYSMMQTSFYTTNNATSMLRFALLLSSLNSTSIRRKIFRIMMLRDRIKNSSDYVSSSQRSSFLSNARSELETAVNNLAIDILPTYFQEDPNQEDIVTKAQENLGKTSTANNIPVPLGKTEGLGSAENFQSRLIEDLLSTIDHQWDNFFSAAKNVESNSSNFNSISWSNGQSTLNATTGITTSLLRLSRDKRAFIFFNKWLSIIDNFPFKLNIYLETTRRTYTEEGLFFDNDRSITATYVVADYFYSPSLYDDLKKALSLTLTGELTPDQFTFYIQYVQPVAKEILQDSQSCADGINFITQYLSQASTLLNDAAARAYEYTPVFGENLINHYTANAILNLNRQVSFAFNSEPTYTNFSKDQYKNTNTLNGFFRFIQDDPEVSTVEDSFAVVCGIPYGLLDRLGAYRRDKTTYLDISILFKTIGGDESQNITIVKTYPATAFIEHQVQEFSDTTNTSYQNVLDATKVSEFVFNPGGFGLDNSAVIEEQAKKNELQSTTLLNYMQLFYGLTLDPRITQQVVLPVITDQKILDARLKLTKEIYSYRFGELVESRYVSTGKNSLRFSQGDLITQALGGCVFDKVVAIPVDASILKHGRENYIVDILINVTTRFTNR